MASFSRLIAIIAIVSPLGCDRGSPAFTSVGARGPAPRVVWQYPWTYAGPNDAIGTEARGVPLITTIRVQFDRFLDPESTHRNAICVRSCTASAECDAPCIEGLEPEYDPVDRVVVWKHATLVAGLRYEVGLLVPANDDDPAGIRAIDGAPLAKEYTFDFTAGDPAKTAPDPDAVQPELLAAESAANERAAIHFCSTSKFCPVPVKGCTTPLSTFSSVEDVLTGCAALANCHGPPPEKPRTPVGSVLVLRDPDGGVPAAITRLVNGMTVATETAVGPDPGVPIRNPKNVFGVNMPYIDGTTKSPGNSFLVYKLILGTAPRCLHRSEESANPDFASLACTAAAGQLVTDEFLCTDIDCMGEDAGAPSRPAVDGGPPGSAMQPAHDIVPAWVPSDRWQPPADGEYDRLRSRIRGDGMGTFGPGTSISFQQARAVSAWIAAGATSTCPAVP